MRNATARHGLVGAVALAVVLFSAEFHADKLHDFVHAVHVNFKEDCDFCHKRGPGDQAPELDEKACEHCHDERGTPARRLPGAGRKLVGIEFVHRDHEKDNECEECHRSTIDDTHAAGTPMVSPDLCISCHSEDDAKKPIARRECRRCHDLNRRNVAPEDHTRTWLARHGRQVRWDPEGGHGERCNECHGTSACVACHRNQRPVSHNGLWRLRMHGTAAMWDRDRCRTCHETGACVSCHRRTPPQNHKGAWLSIHGLAAASQLDSRCLTCHARAECIDCHRGQGQ